MHPYAYWHSFYTTVLIQYLFPVVVDLDFTTLLTFQVISVAFYSEREKVDKFCSGALISACGSFMCRKSTTRDLRLYFPSEGSHTQDFYALNKSIDPSRVWTRDPMASMITTGTPGSRYLFPRCLSCLSWRRTDNQTSLSTLDKCTDIRKYAFPDPCLLDFLSCFGGYYHLSKYSTLVF